MVVCRNPSPKRWTSVSMPFVMEVGLRLGMDELCVDLVNLNIGE